MRLCDIYSVHALFCLYVNGVRLFWRGVRAKRFHLSVYGDGSAPFGPILGDTKVSRTCPRFASVAHVFSSGDHSQVAQPVVITYSVDVVDFTIRPFAMNVKPCKPVKRVGLVINRGSKVPGSVSEPYFVAGFDCVDRTHSPSEKSSFWVVVENLAQAFCCKIVGAHAVAPVKQWFGKRPASVSALCGSRYFSIAGV